AAAAENEQDVSDALYVSEIAVATEGDLAPDAEIVRQGRPISVSEAVALSIRNNLDIEVARFEPMIAEADREGAWGAYDPTINADMLYDVTASPIANFLPGQPQDSSQNKDRIIGGGVGIDQQIPYLGATVGFRYDASATRTRGRLAAYIDDQIDSSLFFNANIPLARNLVWNQAWTEVKTSVIASESARLDFTASLMDTVRNTVDAYWSLVAARDQVRVSQKSLETARALLDQTKTQYEVGVVSRVEVVEAEAGVADREFGVITTANDYRNAQDALIDAVLGPELGALTDLHFAPTEKANEPRTVSVDVGRSVETAFAKRPELLRVLADIDRSEVSLRFAKNQRLPQFDLEMRYGFTGLGGDPNPAPAFGGTTAAQVDFDGVDNDWFRGDGADSYRVRGVFSVPFPNTEARKRVVRSELDLRRAKARQSRQEQTIILEVRRAARTLLASLQGIEAAERRRLAAAEQLRAERIRLEHGESTPFEVLQRESDLVEAESQKINALQSYRSAEIGLGRATGTILEDQDIVLDTAAELQR
ncbi:unnamed protein product, partial [Discosporangium mesarthrocarpum]